MDLNHIILSAEEIAIFFPNQLTILDEDMQTNAPATKEPVVIKGKNRKQFLWLVNEAMHPFLNEADFEFLTQVLEACKMSWDDIALVNMQQRTHTFEEICKQVTPQIILAAAIPTKWLPQANELYLIQNFSGYRFFATDSIEAIRQDKVLKSKLWTALKELTGI
jgi:hypothetical protein